MSQFPIPRGTARAIRRGNPAPSLGFVPFALDEYIAMSGSRGTPEDIADLHLWRKPEVQDAQRQLDEMYYRALREDGHSHYQAMLMSGLGDPHE